MEVEKRVSGRRVRTEEWVRAVWHWAPQGEPPFWAPQMELGAGHVEKPKKYAEKRLARPEEGPYSPSHSHATTSGVRVCTLCAYGLLPV
jgi:hypothetical protein